VRTVFLRRDPDQGIFGMDLHVDHVINYVLPGLPAARVGLRAGDKIVAIGNELVPDSESHDELRVLEHVRDSDWLTLTVAREPPPSSATNPEQQQRHLAWVPAQVVNKDGERTFMPVQSLFIPGKRRLPGYSQVAGTGIDMAASRAALAPEERQALANFEWYHGMPANSATLAEVEAMGGGVAAWTSAGTQAFI
jgi:hypothetical protein